MNLACNSATTSRLALAALPLLLGLLASNNTLRGDEAVWITDSDSLSELSSGERVFLHLTSPTTPVRLTNANGDLSQLSALLQDKATDQSEYPQLSIRCPEKVLTDATTWTQNVVSAHVANENNNGLNVLLPSDPRLLQALFDAQALQLSTVSIAKNVVPSLSFQAYCSGTVQDEAEASGQSQVLVDRLLIHTSPTPLAAKSIQQKLALPGRAFEQSRTFSFNFLEVIAFGLSSFVSSYEEHLERSSPSKLSYIQTLCFDEPESIREINRKKHQAVVEFVSNQNGIVPKDEEIETAARQLSEQLGDARRGARILTNGPGKKLIAVTKEILRGTSDPLFQLQGIRTSYKSLEYNLSDSLLAYFEKDIFGKQVFLGVDYTGVYLVDGETALTIIKGILSGVRFDADAGSDTEAIEATAAHFTDHTPQVPQPPLPLEPSAPRDPFMPIEPPEVRGGGKVLERSALHSLIGAKFDEKAAYAEVKATIDEYKRDLATHESRVKSGYYNSDPRWGAYVKARSDYKNAMIQWRHEVEEILAPWRNKNAKLAKMWPSRKAVILPEIEKLRKQRTMMRIAVNKTERAYESLQKQPATEQASKSRGSVTLVPSLYSYLTVPSQENLDD